MIVRATPRLSLRLASRHDFSGGQVVTQASGYGHEPAPDEP
jgi:hypothetical protein